jgi:hypothetical protein
VVAHEAVEQDGGRDDRHTPGSGLDADVSLGQPAHHPIRRREPEGGSPGEADRMDALHQRGGS